MIGFDFTFYILVDEWVGRFSLLVVLKGTRDSFLQVITSVYDTNRKNLMPLFWQFFFLNINGPIRGLLERTSIL